MIYLIRTDGAIAACETSETAARAEQRGFVRCSQAEWRDGWVDNDNWAFALMRQAARLAPAPQERAVGGVPGGPEQVAGLPVGYVKQWVDGR